MASNEVVGLDFWRRFFSLLSHFLRICILLVPKNKVLIYVINGPQKFVFLFLHMIIKKRRNLR
jgi:hypothetical protein